MLRNLYALLFRAIERGDALAAQTYGDAIRRVATQQKRRG